MNDKSNNENQHNVRFDKYHGLISGTVGGTLNAIIGHPFDTIKVRMQCVDSSYSSTRDCLNSTIKTGGLKAVFNGIHLSVLSMAAETSTVFLTNDIIKRKLLNSDTKTSSSFYYDASIGSISGFIGTIVSCPLETLKCNMQVSSVTSPSMINLTKKIGIRGLFSGFGAACCRNIPFYLCFFPSYSRFLDMVKPYNSKDSSINNIMWCSFAGGVCGVFSWSIVYPLDVIKSNQQIYHNKMSIVQTARNIIKTRGIQGLFAGLVPTTIRAFPANAILMMGVELTNVILKSHPKN
jgi:hypothetical protein